jgi:hypothetical protein
VLGDAVRRYDVSGKGEDVRMAGERSDDEAGGEGSVKAGREELSGFKRNWDASLKAR